MKPTHPDTPATPATPVAQKSRLRELAGRCLQPVEIAAPAVDSRLRQMHPLARAGEVIRYTVLRTEYWLSPRGMLREWLRFNLKIALLLGLPALLLTPFITLLLSSAVEWSAKLAEIARNLVVIPAWVGTALLILSGIGALKRLIFGR